MGTVGGFSPGAPRSVLAAFFLRPAGDVVAGVEFLHALSDSTVGEDEDGVAIFEGDIPSVEDEVVHFLHAGGSEGVELIVTVTTALYALEIVALRRLDGAKTGTATHYVNNQAGNFGAGEVGETFLHQRDSGRGGRGGHLFACGSTAVHHIDGSHFRFSLQDNHTGIFPRFLGHKSFHNFRLRGDGIAEVAVRTTGNHSAGNSFIALHQFQFFCHVISLLLV